MSLPVTADLIGAWETDAAGSLFHWSGSAWVASSANNDTIGQWVPLTVGNSLGNFQNSANPDTLRTPDYPNSIPGIIGTGVIGTQNNLPALADLDVYVGFHSNGVAASGDERLVYSNYLAGLDIYTPNGTLGTVRCSMLEYPSGGNLTFSDPGPHVVHMSRKGAVRLAELDGHTNHDTNSSASTTPISAVPLYLMSTNGGGSSSCSVCCVYIYGRTTAYGGQDATTVNSILNYMASPTRMNVTLSGMPGGGKPPVSLFFPSSLGF